MAKLRIPRSFKEKDLNRSIYDLSQSKVTTMMQGLNIPIKFEIMKPKDEFTIDYRSMIESIPMVGKQLNDWKLRVMLYASDLANYYSWMDNNARLTTAQLENKRHHTISGLPLVSTIVGQGSSTLVNSIVQDYFPDLDSSTPTFNQISRRLSVLPQLFGNDVQYGYDKKPVNDVDTYIPNAVCMSVQPNSLLDYVEFPVHFIVPGKFDTATQFSNTQSYNADYILCYLDAVRNYLVNNQLSEVPYFVVLPNLKMGNNGGNTLYSDGTTNPYIIGLPLDKIDSFLKGLRMQENGVDLLNFAFEQQNFDIAKWLVFLRWGGLFLAQYERDMLNGLLRSVDSENVEVSVDAETGTFSINSFRLANRKQLLKDRFGIAGGRWHNLMRTVWGADDGQSMDIPRLIGTSSYYVAAKSVMSSANTYDEETGNGASLGQLGGVFNSSDLEAKKNRVYTGQHTIFFAIVSLVPDVVYCNGLGKGLDIVSFDDEYYPQFDALGFEDVPRYKYNALPTFAPDGSIAVNSDNNFKRVVGKNIAFIDLISNVNRCHGAFTDDGYFETWVLKRDFNQKIEDAYNTPTHPYVSGNPEEDITSYVNPMAFQYPFAVQSATDNNFVFQIAFDIRAVRSKGKYFMPTLGK